MSIIGVPIIAGASSTKLDSTAIAPAYSASSTYAVGTIVTYNGTVYKCKTAITKAEAWNVSKWEAVTVENQLGGKVDKVAGKGLSTNDYTTAEKNKLDDIENGANKTTVDSEINNSSTNPVQNKIIKAALDGKVDKVNGKQLSTNDYTTVEKTKLGNIQEGANKTIVDAVMSDTSANPVQNKVAKAAIDQVQENLDDLGFSVDNDGALNQTAGTDTVPLIKDSTGKRIRDAIYKIAGIYDLTDYKSITAAVRNGDGAKIPNGTTFTVPHAVYGNIEFVVRRKNVDKVYNDANRPTLTIQAKNLLSNNGGSAVKIFQYDRREAFASIEEEIPAGTVCKFTATKLDDWSAGVYNFTATNAISAGSKLCFDNGSWNSGPLTGRKVLVYADAKGVSPLAQYAIVAGEGSATVNLGTFGVELNYSQRAAYGSNNEAESNIMQFLNGSGLMSDIFVPKTKFDMMCAEYTSLRGFYGGFPQDFLDCLGLCAVHNLTNNAYEAPDSSTQKSSEYMHNAYFWLPSRKEIYGTNENANEDSESQFSYYAEVATTDADKLMYAKGAKSPTPYWMRTPNAGYAYCVRICHAGYGGALGSSYASSSFGVAPLAIIA